MCVCVHCTHASKKVHTANVCRMTGLSTEFWVLGLQLNRQAIGMLLVIPIWYAIASRNERYTLYITHVHTGETCSKTIIVCPSQHFLLCSLDEFKLSTIRTGRALD